jgi:hypothetical protein
MHKRGVMIDGLTLEERSAGSALRLALLAAAGGGGGGGVGDESGDAKEEKRAARSTWCGSEGKEGGAARGRRSSSMAWEVGSPSSAVKEPPLPPPPAVVVEDGSAGAEAGIRVWISAPGTGSSCGGGGEGWRIGAGKAGAGGVWNERGTAEKILERRRRRWEAVAVLIGRRGEVRCRGCACWLARLG